MFGHKTENVAKNLQVLALIELKKSFNLLKIFFANHPNGKCLLEGRAKRLEKFNQNLRTHWLSLFNPEFDQG